MKEDHKWTIGATDGAALDKKVEFSPPPCEGWEQPLVREAYVKGQWDYHEKKWMRESFGKLASGLHGIQAEANAYANVIQLVTHAGLGKARLFFIGNGGSAAIASHCAIDFMKNGGFTTLAFNDGPSLTCITNDLGYENSFALPISRHAMLGDVLFAISSSGRSPNILRAVTIAKERRVNVVTLSGFEPDNPLLRMGAVNFYVPSQEYGTVEIAHLAILHSILDEVIERDR